MAGCHQCDTDETFFYDCEYCGGQFCTEHHEPADHECTGLLFDDQADDESTEEHGRGDQPEAESRSRTAGPDPEPNGKERRDLDRSVTRVGLVAVVLVALVGSVGVGVLWYTPGGESLTTMELSDHTDLPLVDISSETSPGSTVVTDDLNRTEVERLILESVNRRREANGMSPLKYDSGLSTVAEYHSTDMGRHNYTAHVSPGGETLQDRLQKFNQSCHTSSELTLYTYYGRTIQAENGTEHYDTPRELGRGIVRSWMRSDTHRNALVTVPWERAGVGVFVTDSKKVYVTLNLCGEL